MKKSIVIALASVVLASVGGWYYFSSSSGTPTTVARPTEKDAVAAFSGSVRSVIQGVGTATASSTQTLQFNSNGKIVKWNANPGDKVKKGQVLAEVDSTDVDNDIRSQELSLKNAQVSYDKLFSSVKDYQISQQEASIASAERSIASAPVELKNLEMERDAKLTDQKSAIEQTKRSLAIANEKLATLQSDVEYTVASGENTVTKTSTDLTYVLSTAAINAGTQLSESRAFVQDMDASVLRLDNTSLTPPEFSAKDSAKASNAFSAYSVFKGAISPYATKLAGANLTTTGGVLEFLSEREKLAIAWVSATDALSQALEASLAAENLSQSSIDSLSNSVSQARSKFSSYVTDVASVRKQIASLDNPDLVRQSADNAVANKKQSMLEQQSNVKNLTATLASQEAALTKLESDYLIKIRQKRDSLASLEESLKTAKLNLADMRDGPTKEEIQSALNQIELSKISLAKARKKKEDYQIIAGFDGVITASNGKVGEISTNSNSSSTTSTSVTVEVPGLYEISVLVDQLDVVKIKEGQTAEIKFDAYSDQTFTGKVSQVDPTPTTNQGVVSYKALILFQSEDLRLYNSMTATVAIVTEERFGAVMVPTAAITENGGKKTVRVWKNGRPAPVEVTTGLVSGSNTEILTGVSIGDKVVSTAFSISTVNRSSGFSIFGWASWRTRPSGASTNSSSSRSSAPQGSGMGGPPPGMQ